MLPYTDKQKQISRKLRAAMTDAERTLWPRLRRKQFLGLQFYRQKPVGPYTVDFYCAEVHLAVEIDGSQHLEAEQARLDKEREGFLRQQGLTIIRFDNRQVLLQTDAVLEEIYRVCERLKAKGQSQKSLNP